MTGAAVCDWLDVRSICESTVLAPLTGRFRVTMWLVRDHAAAQDLVQDTFRWRFTRSTGSGQARTRVRGCSRSCVTQTPQQVTGRRPGGGGSGPAVVIRTRLMADR